MSNRQRKREHLAREQLRADIAEILAKPSGRRYLWELLNRGFLFSSIWSGNSEIHKHEGMRMFALSIKDDIESVDPRLFLDVLAVRMNEETPEEVLADDEANVNA